MTLNNKFSTLLAELGVKIPQVLLPRADVDLQKWSVVACDQYTSDHAYWNRVEDIVGEAPSSLRVTLPEIYLEQPGIEDRIDAIHRSMKEYLLSSVIEGKGEAIIYVERTTAASGLRQGIMLAMDLERYDYSPGSKSLIRATEGTIVDRIPPRLQVRRAAKLELPHIMILIDDPDQKIIEGLAPQMKDRPAAYDIDLMANGGHLRGVRIDNELEVHSLLLSLSELLTKTKLDQKSETPLFFAMGDGNHSLATAKALWEEIKAAHVKEKGTTNGLEDHPARYALAEIVNIHSPGLRFEPIHRAVFTTKREQMLAHINSSPEVESTETIAESEARKLLSSPSGQDVAVYFDGEIFRIIRFRKNLNVLPPARIDRLHADFRAIDDTARIDFIHGWQDNKKLSSEGAVCFFVPVIARERLFGQVQEHGPLPRKAFSMGDAEEKRYYMESREIQS